MKIAFVDTSGIIYDEKTFLTKPLGGTESAVCGLVTALKKNYVLPKIINVSQESKEAEIISYEEINKYDILIVISRPLECLKLRREYNYKGKIIYWTGESYDQPVNRFLSDIDVVNSIDKVVLLTHWHKCNMIMHFPLIKNKAVVIRFGMNETFKNISNLSKEPTMIYISTPYRGLDVLLRAFPLIKEEIPYAKLEIYSGMNLYSRDEQDVKFESLYEIARNTPDVTYSPAIDQATLAEKLAKAAIFSYPCTYEETFCTALVNAMGTGCYPIITTLGPLPEVSLGFGRTINIKRYTNPDEFIVNYANEVITTFRHLEANDKSLGAEIEAMITYTRNYYNWNYISEEWLDLFRSFGITI
jgi:glycosyltransferase involved in cell wall biosynthesis